MKVLSLALALVACSACGSDTPTAPAPPPPPPAANLSQQGTLNFTVCLGGASSCQIRGEVVNTGAGCAQNVRGVTEVMNSAGTVMDSASWAWPSRVRPNEVFTYVTCCVTSVNITTYRVRPSWDNVSCQ